MTEISYDLFECDARDCKNPNGIYTGDLVLHCENNIHICTNCLQEIHDSSEAIKTIINSRTEKIDEKQKTLF